MDNKQPHQNQIEAYRRRMTFSTGHVARLLGHGDTSTYRDYERGERLPSLVNAFRLGIILRVPLEFLFPDLYDELKKAIRAEEERLAMPVQQPLF
jgi:transcriptional regulator with XRE-family HTH domain